MLGKRDREWLTALVPPETPGIQRFIENLLSHRSSCGAPRGLPKVWRTSSRQEGRCAMMEETGFATEYSDEHGCWAAKPTHYIACLPDVFSLPLAASNIVKDRRSHGNAEI